MLSSFTSSRALTTSSRQRHDMGIIMKQVLVIKAHPRDDSLCAAMAAEYVVGAVEAGHDVGTLEVRDLGLEQFVNYGHPGGFTPTVQIAQAQEQMAWADHLVFVYPTWWGLPPGNLKLFFEMTFTPGFAYKYQPPRGRRVVWDKLLAGRSARLLVTMDSPPVYYSRLIGDPGFKAMKRTILGFCGIDPVHKHYFGSVKTSTEAQRTAWLHKARAIGQVE